MRTFVFLSLLSLVCFRTSLAQVRVRGYTKLDGTNVKSHMRSNPDGNPYNNWSYPGNTNPYTGKVAPGNPSTYLDNLSNEKAPSTSSNLTSSETSSEAEKELIAMGVKSEYVSKYKEKKEQSC